MKIHVTPRNTVSIVVSDLLNCIIDIGTDVSFRFKVLLIASFV